MPSRTKFASNFPLRNHHLAPHHTPPSLPHHQLHSSRIPSFAKHLQGSHSHTHISRLPCRGAPLRSGAAWIGLGVRRELLLQGCRSQCAAMVRDASDVQLQEVDVVVVALQPDLSYLAPWRGLLKGCHLIVVQGEDFAGAIRVPEGFDDVEVHTRADIVERLGAELAGALQFTGYGSRGFGYLVARRRYVFTMEADCAPALDPEGYVVNPVEAHVRNLTTPATPFFFNTLYDPFREGADFVRGYPFSLREGVPTAISQGSWTSPGCKRYVDAVLTVPRFVLYTASGANLAFDRRRVGPLMFEPPQLGSGTELWAGLCAKTVCDRCPWGVKTGLPYVRRSESAALEQGEGGSDRLDLIAQFFHTAQLSGNPLDVEGCYLELAEQAQSKLAAVDPVFKEVASAMRAWIQAWKKLGR